MHSDAAANGRKVVLFYFCIFSGLWAILFFSDAEMAFKYDWPAWNSWASVWAKSFDKGDMPYYATYFEGDLYNINILGWGDKFFATPFISLNPFVLLLNRLGLVGSAYVFFMANFLIAFYYFRRICKDFNLSKEGGVIFAIMWFFSGYIVYRMLAGHIQLAGYLHVIPYLWLLYKIQNVNNPAQLNKYSYNVFFLLLFIGASAGYHIIQQWLIIGLLFSAHSKTSFYYSMKPFLFLAPCLLYFIAPNFLYGTYIGDEGRYIQNGSLVWLSNDGMLWAFANRILNTVIFLTIPIGMDVDGSWENSLYIGVVGSIILLFGLAHFVTKRKHKLIGAKVFITVLLAYYFNEAVFNNTLHPLGIPAVDRLSVRMMIYPVSVMILYSVFLLEQKCSNKSLRRIAWLVMIEHVIGFAYVLASLKNELSITYTEKPVVKINSEIANLTITPVYEIIVNWSLIVSLSFILFFIFNWFVMVKKA